MCEKKELDEELFSIVSNEILEEVKNASKTYRSFVNYHHGYAVLKEEVDELWDLIKITKKGGIKTQRLNMYKELIQIGAMVHRFINDLLDLQPRLVYGELQNGEKVLFQYSYLLCENCWDIARDTNVVKVKEYYIEQSYCFDCLEKEHKNLHNEAMEVDEIKTINFNEEIDNE